MEGRVIVTRRRSVRPRRKLTIWRLAPFLSPPADLTPRRSTRIKNVEVRKRQRRSSIRKLLHPKMQSENHGLPAITNNSEVDSLDELGHYWSMNDIKIYVATFNKYPKDWATIAEAVNRSKHSVVAFYDNCWVDNSEGVLEKQAVFIRNKVDAIYGRPAPVCDAVARPRSA